MKTNKLKFDFHQWKERNKENIIQFVQEIIIVIGYGLFCYGIYLIYRPAMWIALGLGLLKIGLPGGKK
jgi:hypothetical protein